MKITNPIVANAIAKPVCNGIGDCYYDTLLCIKDAVKAKSTSEIKKNLMDAKKEVQYAMTYIDPDATDKNKYNSCVRAIDKAIADPSNKNILDAGWECEKARAFYEGGSPRRAWNSAIAEPVAANAITPKFKYIATVEGTSIERTFNTLEAAKAFFKNVTYGGAKWDRISFDDWNKYNHAKGKICDGAEMCVYGDFDNPSLRNAGRMIGIITAEEVAVAKNMDLKSVDKLQDYFVDTFLHLQKLNREIRTEKRLQRIWKYVESAIDNLRSAADGTVWAMAEEYPNN